MGYFTRKSAKTFPSGYVVVYIQMKVRPFNAGNVSKTFYVKRSTLMYTSNVHLHKTIVRSDR